MPTKGILVWDGGVFHCKKNAGRDTNIPVWKRGGVELGWGLMSVWKGGRKLPEPGSGIS